MKNQSCKEKIVELYEKNCMETLIEIRHQIKRYGRCIQLEAGGGGWEDPGTGFNQALGSDISAHYKSIANYVDDDKGRKELAEKIRKDCLERISDILGIKIKDENGFDEIGSGFDSIGGIDYFEN